MWACVWMMDGGMGCYQEEHVSLSATFTRGLTGQWHARTWAAVTQMSRASFPVPASLPKICDMLSSSIPPLFGALSPSSLLFSLSLSLSHCLSLSALTLSCSLSLLSSWPPSSSYCSQPIKVTFGLSIGRGSPSPSVYYHFVILVIYPSLISYDWV